MPARAGPGTLTRGRQSAGPVARPFPGECEATAMRMDDRVKLTGKQPPPQLTAQTVAEELGWSVSRLLGYIATGCLPPPEVVNGVYRFSLTYALQVRCDGLSIPGTWPGLPPGSPFRANQKPLAARRGKPRKKPAPKPGAAATRARVERGGAQ